MISSINQRQKTEDQDTTQFKSFQETEHHISREKKREKEEDQAVECNIDLFCNIQSAIVCISTLL